VLTAACCEHHLSSSREGHRFHSHSSLVAQAIDRERLALIEADLRAIHLERNLFLGHGLSVRVPESFIDVQLHDRHWRLLRLQRLITEGANFTVADVDLQVHCLFAIPSDFQRRNNRTVN